MWTIAPMTAALRVKLLATESSGGGMHQLLLAGILLIAAFVLGGVVLLLLRRKLFDKGTKVHLDETLEHLERLHKYGLISDEEFSRARRASLGVPMQEAVSPDPQQDCEPTEGQNEQECQEGPSAGGGSPEA